MGAPSPTSSPLSSEQMVNQRRWRIRDNRGMRSDREIKVDRGIGLMDSEEIYSLELINLGLADFELVDLKMDEITS